jgi:hypothetical protein
VWFFEIMPVYANFLEQREDMCHGREDLEKHRERTFVVCPIDFWTPNMKLPRPQFGLVLQRIIP